MQSPPDRDHRGVRADHRPGNPLDGPNAITARDATTSASAAMPPNQTSKAMSAPQAMRRAWPRDAVNSRRRVQIRRPVFPPRRSGASISRPRRRVPTAAIPGATGSEWRTARSPRASPERHPPRQNGREDAPVSGDFKDVRGRAPRARAGFRYIPDSAASRSTSPPSPQIADFLDLGIGREVLRAQDVDDAHDPQIGGRIAGERADRDRIDRLAAIFQAQREAALEAAQRDCPARTASRARSAASVGQNG